MFLNILCKFQLFFPTVASTNWHSFPQTWTQKQSNNVGWVGEAIVRTATGCLRSTPIVPGSGWVGLIERHSSKWLTTAVLPNGGRDFFSFFFFFSTKSAGGSKNGEIIFLSFPGVWFWQIPLIAFISSSVQKCSPFVKLFVCPNVHEWSYDEAVRLSWIFG